MPVTHVEGSFRVLFVCTANLCRSPMAQYLLDHQVRSTWPATADQWKVHSAGTAVREGSDMHPQAEHALNDRHIRPGPFVRTALAPDLIAEADLVLTAGADHRSAVIRLLPTAAAHTFTIKQFGRLCADVRASPPELTPAGAGRWLLEQARSRRGHQGLVDPRTEELHDPMGAGMRAFRRCADTIQQSIDSVMAPLTPSG